jgi:hypothetical protein
MLPCRWCWCVDGESCLTDVCAGASAVIGLHPAMSHILLNRCGLVGRWFWFRPNNAAHRRQGDQLPGAHRAANIPAPSRKAISIMDAAVQQTSAVQGEAPDQHQVGRQCAPTSGVPPPRKQPGHGSPCRDSPICVVQPCKAACINSQPPRHTGVSCTCTWVTLSVVQPGAAGLVHMEPVVRSPPNCSPSTVTS